MLNHKQNVFFSLAHCQRWKLKIEKLFDALKMLCLCADMHGRHLDKTWTDPNDDFEKTDSMQVTPGSQKSKNYPNRPIGTGLMILFKNWMRTLLCLLNWFNWSSHHYFYNIIEWTSNCIDLVKYFRTFQFMIRCYYLVS